MFEILTVCTGNICRSPLAEQLLRTQLQDLPGRVLSAGTQGFDAAPMPDDAQRLAGIHGVGTDMAAAHRSQRLTPALLQSPDLILAMAREHRRGVVDIAPARLRSTFTVREFARLAADTTDSDIADAARAAGDNPSARLRAAVAAVAAQRGVSAPPVDPLDDDVIDPYRQTWDIYERSGQELSPAIAQVVRVVRTAMTA